MRDRVAYLREFLKSPQGSMTVEFVAFAPLLLSTLVVSFEFGRAFWAYDVITRDVRSAVRYLSRDTASPPPYMGDTCPAAARYVAQTGSPYAADFTEANKHFPWKGAAPTFTCPVAVTIDPAVYNNDGYVVQMTASVPLTLSLLDFIERISGASIPRYPLTVSYRARYIGN